MEVLPLNDHVCDGEAVLPKEMDKGVYVGVEDDDDDSKSEAGDDGLGDIWNEMAMAIECSKDVTEEASNTEQKQEEKEDCEHSFVLKDDMGYVCCICGLVERSISEIIDVRFSQITAILILGNWSFNVKEAGITKNLKKKRTKQALHEIGF